MRRFIVRQERIYLRRPKVNRVVNPTLRRGAESEPEAVFKIRELVKLRDDTIRGEIVNASFHCAPRKNLSASPKS